MKNKYPIYVIAGGSGNIGQEVIAVLKKRGAGIVAVDSQFNKQDSLLNAPTAEQVLQYRLDLTDENQVKHFFSGLAKWSHKFCAVINCSGSVLFKPFLETSMTDLRSVLDANLVAAFILTKEAINIMRLNGGRIIHLGSIAGNVSLAGNACYGAAKAALAQFSRVVNTEFNFYRIQSTVLILGAVKSSIWDHYPEFDSTQMLTLSEVAAKIFFILEQPISVKIEEITLLPTAGILNV